MVAATKKQYQQEYELSECKERSSLPPNILVFTDLTFTGKANKWLHSFGSSFVNFDGRAVIPDEARCFFFLKRQLWTIRNLVKRLLESAKFAFKFFIILKSFFKNYSFI